ncbi:UDP-2,4-diacetamido-2,4,6-trideoxy-beta-L-altropyranose hydrolase [Pararhodobacter sp.]|uniref:UDP-2,4-diacetamido-2,4, 6-trideoxy-beta-L-altropyranose hydrolase n=1 Tax=Pararhodobacter sp. TaxID=2127056 RepID=UPI002AFF7C32|nr:UDP-2,4-diacetamido-2,4,6-trideoxy-beta-L-altropyranose hydrolase [Pararhodobacter sp.]
MRDGPASAPRIIFRADASVRIGTGHVMRCLTLADALRERGAETLFLCRPLEGDLRRQIAARGHSVLALPTLAPGAGSASGSTPADWLGTDQAGDAGDCLAVLAGAPAADWLVVDHYALGQEWERRLRPVCGRIMAIDDLADRVHDCDLLLDPGLGRVATDYDGLLPDGAVALLGPEYALLRPEFAAHRAASLARRAKPELRRVLVTLGGADIDNVTCRVLDALAASQLPDEVSITVVMGPSAPWLEAVRARAADMRFPVEVLVGVGNMAELMTESDLAIGAAGSTAWERCCLGLPTIQMVLADNQSGIARGLEASGMARTVLVENCGRDIPALLATTERQNALLQMAKTEMIDGQSAWRVASLMTGDTW